jgi:hypothetical protein
MKNIDNLEELRKINENGKIKINGIEEVVTGIFSESLVTYKEINNRIEVREYDFKKDLLDYNLIEAFNENSREYFQLKDIIDSYQE